MLDGEIVIAASTGLDFDALQLRIHPAASRVKLLSQQIPASVVFFDLLSIDDRDLCDEPFERRRAELESLLASATPPIHLTPATRDTATARDWFKRFEGAGLDGVMAKPIIGTYQPNKRTMLKVKHERDCDCVVAGFRWHKDAENEAIGSCCLASTTPQAHSNMSASAPASPRPSAASWSNSSSPTATTHSQITHGSHGPKP